MMDKETIKEFFKPDKWKIILIFVIPIALTIQEVCIGPKCMDGWSYGLKILLIPLAIYIPYLIVDKIQHGPDTPMQAVVGEWNPDSLIIQEISEKLFILIPVVIFNYLLACILIHFYHKYKNR